MVVPAVGRIHSVRLRGVCVPVCVVHRIQAGRVPATTAAYGRQTDADLVDPDSGRSAAVRGCVRGVLVHSRIPSRTRARARRTRGRHAQAVRRNRYLHCGYQPYPRSPRTVPPTETPRRGRVFLGPVRSAGHHPGAGSVSVRGLSALDVFYHVRLGPLYAAHR